MAFLSEIKSYFLESAFELHVLSSQYIGKQLSSKEFWRYYIYPQHVEKSSNVEGCLIKRQLKLINDGTYEF